MPDAYRVRLAAVGDLETIVHHRVAMFSDMGTQFDVDATAAAFRRWAADALRSELYRGWLVEDEGTIVAGAGITVVPWPPGPRDVSGWTAFVYNVYTEPAHRGRGLARRVMQEIHAWCRAQHIRVVALAASDAGRPLYESLGYRAPANPYLFVLLE